MKETKVECTKTVIFYYDEYTDEFQTALSSFKDMIDSDGDIDSLLEHVAHNITQFGIDTMVEGVGYVNERGKYPDNIPFSGIFVERGYNDVDYCVW